MQAVRLVAPTRPLELQHVPVPELGAGDVLVRIKAAGICHSDVHYRAGRSPTGPLPLTLGHEIAGIVERAGPDVTRLAAGDRVCLHYLLVCGECPECVAGHEQFCARGAMLGHHVDGGYAEFITVPEWNVLALPDDVAFEHGAVMMCASATSYHALKKGRVQPGDRVAVFGAGGLGMSAVQIAIALGAAEVYVVDLDPRKLKLAEHYGAVPIDASSTDAVAAIRGATVGRGVDVALEVVGHAVTVAQSVQSLGVRGRAVIAGISSVPVPIDTYRELIGKEAEIIGSNDHLRSELEAVIALAHRKQLVLNDVVTRTVGLEARAVNSVLDELSRFSAPARTVIVN